MFFYYVLSFFVFYSMSLSRRKKFYQTKAKYRSTVVARPYTFFYYFIILFRLMLYIIVLTEKHNSALKPNKPLSTRDFFIFINVAELK